MSTTPWICFAVILMLAILAGLCLFVWFMVRAARRHGIRSVENPHEFGYSSPVPLAAAGFVSPQASRALAPRVESISGIVQRAPARDVQFVYSTGDRPLDGYTIKRGIGRGGFGEVYYAVSDGGKEVALKLVQRHLDVELRGVGQCLNLKHANLVTIYDVKQAANGDTWVVMEYLSGACLSDVLAANPNGLPHDQVNAWLRGIADGVGNLHEHGIVHRDLKPGNIFVEHGIVKIGDYGLAKYISASRRNGQTESVGTVHYMAPEISHGRYGKEIDLYALGVILYELLTGRVPFNGQSPGEIMMKHLTAQPDTSVLPEPYRAVVARLLAKAPEERCQSVQQIVAELGGDVEAAPSPLAPARAVHRQSPLRHTVSWHPAEEIPALKTIEVSSNLIRWITPICLTSITILIAALAVGFWDSHLQASRMSGGGNVFAALVLSGGALLLLFLSGLAWIWCLRTSVPGVGLVNAAARGDTSQVVALLDQGVDVNARDKRGVSALMHAAGAGHTSLVELLLERGADVNARTRGGETALSLATVAGHTAVVEVLLAAGADVNSRASDGDTPLIEAAYAGHVAILRAMLEHGPDLNARSSGDGSTPLIWAAYEGQSACVEALLEHGAKPNEKDTGDGSTPLIWAAYGNYPNVVRVLLDHGADPIETNSSGETALDHAESDTITQMLSAAIAQR